MIRRDFRLAAVSLLLGVLAAVIAPTAANAATEAVPGAALVGPGGLVTAQPWDHDQVTCESVNKDGEWIVNCQANNPSDITDTTCFIDVRTDGSGRATVCTTYEGHHGQLADAEGEEGKIEFGCGFGDLACLYFETAAIAASTNSTVISMMVVDNVRFNVGGTLWDTATGEWAYWAWAVLGILFIAMVYSIAAAVFSGERDRLLGAIVRSFVAFPAMAITVWVLGYMIRAFDDWTVDVLDRGQGLIGVFRTFHALSYAGGQGNMLTGFTLHVAIWIGFLLLLLVLTLRNLGIAVLIMAIPVAWMIYPVHRIGNQWIAGLGSGFATLLLTGPLTMGYVMMMLNGLGNLQSVWDPQAWAYILGLALVIVAPFAIFGMFSFVGGAAVDAISSRAGSGGMRMASSAGRSITKAGSNDRSRAGRSGHRPAGTGPQGSRPSVGDGQQPAATQTGPRTDAQPAGGPSSSGGSPPWAGPVTATSRPASTPPAPSTPPGRSESPLPSRRDLRGAR